MKKIIIQCLALWVWQGAQSQDTLIEKPYFYDDFQSGQAYFSEGDPVSAKFNYNFVLQEIQFLNPHKTDEILSLTRQPKLTHIQIGNDIFVPVDNRGFAHVVQDGPVTLLQKKRILVETNKAGAYGAPTNTAAVETPAYLYTTGAYTQGAFTNRIGTESKARLELDFYLMKNSKTYPASKRNYLRLYPEIKSQIEQFLSEHTVNFNDIEDLQKLTKHCNNLMTKK